VHVPQQVMTIAPGRKISQKDRLPDVAQPPVRVQPEGLSIIQPTATPWVTVCPRGAKPWKGAIAWRYTALSELGGL